MAEITVEQLAKVVGLPIKQLLEKLNKAGVELHDAKQVVTDQQRQLFLRYLKGGLAPKGAEKPISLNATTASSKDVTLKAGENIKKKRTPSDGGINVTVLKKRVRYNAEELMAKEREAVQEVAEEGDGGVHEIATTVAATDDHNVAMQVAAAEATEIAGSDNCSASVVVAEGNAAANDGAVVENGNLDSEIAGKSDERLDDQAVMAAPEEAFMDEVTDSDEDDGDAAIALARSSAKGGSFVDAERGDRYKDAANSKMRKSVGGSMNGNAQHGKDKGRGTKARSIGEGHGDERVGSRANSSSNKGSRFNGGNKAAGKRDERASGSNGAISGNAGARRDHAANIVVSVPESLTVAELAQKMSLKAVEVIKSMMKMGIMATINQVLDQDTAALVAGEMGYQVNLVKDVILDDTLVLEERQDIAKLPRAPVVTIMGHVDHGKTSLLDYIRRTKVAAKEAGGITQHIGAYRVTTERGVITFLDTPGHEAFTAMRARGAQCTDIVVLVVAADDGVMPQTIEAIQHAHAAKVPIVVAVNKIDKPGAEPEKIKTELANHQVIPEEWGGDVIFQHISAKRGDGIDELLESILIVAEMQQLVAPVECPAKGVVLEAHLDKGHGPVASMLVQEGTLHQGDVVLAGLYFGKVRAMFNDVGNKIATATPSVPVEILGMSGVPSAGDDFLVLPSEKRAREVSIFRHSKHRAAKLAKQQASKMEDILAKMKEGGNKEEGKTLNVVLKTDLQGSSEAISEALGKLCIDNVKVAVVASGVGGITSSDINLALASNGVVIGFNVRADASARALAENEGVDLRYYSIIYQLLDDVKSAMTGLLAPKYEEQIVGLAEVREVFRSSKFGTVAGCKVADGLMKRGGSIRLLRSQVVIYEGEIESIRRFKEDVVEVRQGMECGIGIKGYSDLKAGDQIEMFKQVLVKR